MAQRDLTQGSLVTHLIAMVGPAALGMVFSTLYNVVDTFYAGWISTDAQAGLSVSFSVFMILTSIGFGLSQGASALIGGAIGARKADDAKATAAQALVFAALLGVTLAMVGVAITSTALTLLEAPPGVFDAADSYLRLLFLGLPGFLIGFTANGILTAQGDTKSNRNAQLAAFLANLALNPLLIYGIAGVPGLGFDGIAISTALIQTCVALWLTRRALATDAMSGASANDARPTAKVIAALTRQGAPASFAMIVMMFGMLIIQSHLQPFGAPAIAGYGIAFRVEQLILLPILSISFSVMPMVAQNYGAEDYDRVQQAVTMAASAALACAIAGAIVLALGGVAVTSLFTSDEATIAAGASYLRLAALMMPAYAFMFILTALFQGLRRPIWSVVIGLYRQVAALAVLPPLFAYRFDLGLDGIWIGLFAAVWTGLVLALVIAVVVCRRALGQFRVDFGAFRQDNTPLAP
ncbi:MAG: MATE family efflux transporter [Pseudomonadota bacterium]